MLFHGDILMQSTRHFEPRHILIPAGILLLAAVPGFGSTAGQASTAPGAAFAGACAGNEAFSGLPSPGSVLNNGVGINFGDGVSYFTCNTMYSAIGGTATQSASNSGNFAGNLWNNNGTASAAPKQIHLNGTNNGAPDTEFSGATANGGWNDNYTLQITDPSVTITSANPVSGYWVVPVVVDGQLSATGPNGWAKLSIGVYQNYNEVNQFSTGGAPGWSYFTSHNTVANGDIGSGDNMEVAWGSSSNGITPTLDVNTTVYFAVPVTFTSNSDSFEAGIYAGFEVAETSFGAGSALDTATVSFQNTFGWGGPGQLVLNGTTYQSNQFDVSGISGANYESAFTEAAPEPSTFVLAGAACAGLLVRRRRVRRV